MDAIYDGLYANTKANAKKRGIQFDITEEEFTRLVAKHKNKCAVTGIEFSNNSKAHETRRPFAPSIDRIDSSGWYTYRNTRLVCIAANIAMNEWGEYVLIKMAKAICGNEEARKQEEIIEKKQEKNEFVKYLDRAEAAQYINERGLKVSKNTIQKWVTVGGGPRYQRFGHRAVYMKSELDSWIAQKLSAPSMTYQRHAGI